MWMRTGMKFKKLALDKPKMNIKKLGEIVSFGAEHRTDKKELLASSDQMALDSTRTQQDNRKLSTETPFSRFSRTTFFFLSAIM